MFDAQTVTKHENTRKTSTRIYSKTLRLFPDIPGQWKPWAVIIAASDSTSELVTVGSPMFAVISGRRWGPGGPVGAPWRGWRRQVRGGADHSRVPCDSRDGAVAVDVGQSPATWGTTVWFHKLRPRRCDIITGSGLGWWTLSSDSSRWLTGWGTRQRHGGRRRLQTTCSTI